MNTDDFLIKWKYKHVEGFGICDCEKELVEDLSKLHNSEIDSLKEQLAIASEQIPKGALNLADCPVCKNTGKVFVSTPTVGGGYTTTCYLCNGLNIKL